MKTACVHSPMEHGLFGRKESELIRTIFFDYDGVLTTDKSGSLTTCRYLSEASGIALSTINAAFHPYAGDLFTGRARHADIWSGVCESLNSDLDIGLLFEAFESTPLNGAMVSLARTLQAHHSIGIITDNPIDRMDHLRVHQDLDSLFSPIVASAEVGSSKQGQEIFLSAMSRASVAPEECIFIDNSEPNVAMARTLGMHAIFHDDGKNDIDALAKELRRLGARADS
ncbi:HAD-IA family hydrolase [Dyella terrae]|nr:HAD-IA family hydrolase [Dyella terrae]